MDDVQLGSRSGFEVAQGLNEPVPELWIENGSAQTAGHESAGERAL